MDHFQAQCHGYMAGWQVRGSLLHETEAESLASQLETDEQIRRAFIAGVRRALLAEKGNSVGYGWGHVSHGYINGHPT
ncbi:MAG: hypothetical protein U0795_19785 [Pirellulales bacterium]